MLRAGFGIRLAAAAIDVVAMYVLNVVTTALAFPMMAMQQSRGAAPTANRVMTLMLSVTAFLWLAYASTELFGRASPGKRILKLRIASAADGGPASMGQRVWRWSLKYLPVLLYIVAMGTIYTSIGKPGGPPPWFFATMIAFGLSLLVVVGGFFATLGGDRRALHDYVGGTVVLKAGQAPQGFAPIMAQPVAPAQGDGGTA